MNVAQFKDELKKVYAKYFNESALRIESTHGIYRNIVIQCYLIKDSTEAINRIAMNDMFRISFSITHNGNEFTRDDKLKLKYEFRKPKNTNSKEKIRNYVIKVGNYGYAYKLVAKGFRYTEQKNYAMGFEKESQALKYIEKLQAKMGSGYQFTCERLVQER